MSGLEILSLAGPASVQDGGRPGWQRWGVPEGGALDIHALAEGQALLGNAPDAAALEMPGAGGRFRAQAAMVVATSGAEMALRVNGVARGWRSALALGPGETLEIGAAREGAIGYLHLPGGIDAPVELGARSAHRRAGLGLVPTAGDVLRPLGRGGVAGRSLPRPAHFDRRCIRAMWGPQSALFDAASRARFAAETWTATPFRDRQGIRIAAAGGPFEAALGLTTLSEAVVLGDIQMLGTGEPVVLLADRQPTGGIRASRPRFRPICRRLFRCRPVRVSGSRWSTARPPWPPGRRCAPRSRRCPKGWCRPRPRGWQPST
ncbi:MAG: biotin-dependent carboxyltransferase family protein [Rhodobacteraceae bacterium]|nr:biotin-dependent carboxyltransferase family protein [Paracoccaceae bacterium]